ncbi:MAG: hypothetical protein LBI82_10440 [Dysgonamonadaceae bacterium]|jgi:hypothetical protein|nr:hypothetical protein [Dysgonamonadaceae bacterium]
MKQRLLKTLVTFCALILFSGNCLAQNKNEISVYVGFVQLKEELAQSMVYRGPQVGFQYQRNWFFEKWELRYNPKLAVGVPFNRGMIGASFHFVPIDFSGLKPVYQNDNHSLRLGMNFATNYTYQFYPKQLGANMFRYTEIGIAPCIEYGYQWNQSKIKIFLQNSLAGFVSRTENVPPYFYSLKVSDFVVKPHQNMQFGSFDKYNHTNASVEYIPDTSKNHSFALGVEYIDSYFSNRFQSLNYYLQWKKSF